jgi:hypothetical protein
MSSLYNFIQSFVARYIFDPGILCQYSLQPSNANTQGAEILGDAENRLFQKHR